jgi:hypothetical protein
MVRVFSKILQKKEYTGNYESYQRQTSFIRKHKPLVMCNDINLTSQSDLLSLLRSYEKVLDSWISF